MSTILNDRPTSPSATHRGDASSICDVIGVHHRYGETSVLSGIDLNVAGGEIVAVLGRNGSGKTTLFRLLSTLMPIQRGRILVDGVDASADPIGVRSRIGIIFQSPSLDIKLTVAENMRCQGVLYGLHGRSLASAIDQRLAQFGLTDRRGDLCQTLSGGLKRRVELAKGLLHRPRWMLLDEPSTGLDPAARLALWQSLRELADDGVGVLLTTHLMDEAAKASRLVILDGGQKIADDSPAAMRREIGGSILTIVARDRATAAVRLREQLNLDLTPVGETLRGSCDSPEMVPHVAALLGDEVQSITIGRPSLEDVFIAKTGQAFDVAVADEPTPPTKGGRRVQRR